MIPDWFSFRDLFWLLVCWCSLSVLFLVPYAYVMWLHREEGKR